MKNIVELIEEQFYSFWIKRNVFTHSEIFPDQTKKVKLTHLQILKSSQNKVRNSVKDTGGNLDPKKHLVL